MDALGNPTGFHLTPGQAYDLEGTDVLLPQTQGEPMIADRAYDAQERVITLWRMRTKALLSRRPALESRSVTMTIIFTKRAI